MRNSISFLKDKEIREVFALLSSKFPNPKSELNFNNPFELLCAVVLSAQATDVSVNKVTPELFRLAPTPELMVELGVDNIADKIKTIGLWRAKSEHLYNLSVMLVEQYDGVVPDVYEELVKLPGVGSKTAKVVLNVAFSKPTIAVDTHIFRVCNRTGLCPGKNVAAVENNLPKLVPEEYAIKAHHLLLLHGRYTCKARSPECDKCEISALCHKNGVNS